MNDWLNIDENAIENGAIGFVYMIEFDDKFYIGKKNLFSHITKKSTYKNGKERKIKVIKESDWRNYCSSNDYLKSQKKIAPERFKRVILRYCYSAKELTYREMEYQVKYDCLEKENCLVDNILGKFFKKDLNKSKQ